MINTIEDLVDNITNIEINEKTKQDIKEEEIFDTIQEQIETPDTTVHCPESIKEKELKYINKNPQNYIEINIVKKIRIVDTFYISSKIRQFHYKTKEYNIDEEEIYLISNKSGFFTPTCFYYENNNKPTSFKQTNEGITGKALSLLYNPELFKDLFSEDENKYNLVIVLLLIASISCFLFGLWLQFKDVIL